MITLVANADDERLDRFLAASIAGLSRNDADTLVQNGGVKIDGRTCRKKGERLSTGAKLTIDLRALDERSEDVRAVLQAKAADLRLLDRGDDWAVVRKPAGLGSTPGFFGDTLAFSVFAAKLLASEWPEPRSLQDDGLVHRLDVGTSGASVIARTQAALDRLRHDRDHGRLARTYWAIVPARVNDSGTITNAIAHKRGDDTRMVTIDQPYRGEPQIATTRYRVLGRAEDAALVEVKIEGGRRHQIRVHMASIGCALFGDELYGGPGVPTRLALHATYVDLVCPVRGAVKAKAEPGAHFFAFAPALTRVP